MNTHSIRARATGKNRAVAAFGAGEEVWIRRFGNLRNTIRQEVVRRQLSDHARAGMTVLDVGCGQGTQAIKLARLGCIVTGVDPSEALRDACATNAAAQGLAIELLDGRIEELNETLQGRTFDLVCAHGLLMYLDDRAAAIATLAHRVARGGKLSITFRNGHALAMRPALRRDWSAALDAFDTKTYINELGVEATADRLEDVTADLDAVGLYVEAWYGVRVFNDAVSSDMNLPDNEDLAALLDAEDQAGRRDPYRWMASQFHVIARREVRLRPR
jgi:S-adenosylmethionine-dependent methyltransferase